RIQIFAQRRDRPKWDVLKLALGPMIALIYMVPTVTRANHSSKRPTSITVDTNSAIQLTI
ncbi:MAG: hypothetical protein KKA35_12220, partial [Proteobacteria bacterium]|nr:hypothetical protein [Pseudomonadota bacterium]